MHYILLAIALNLGEKNVNLVKLSNLEESPKAVQIARNNNSQQNNGEIKGAITPQVNLNDESLIIESPIIDDEKLSAPYIESENFAELLPEDEVQSAESRKGIMDGDSEEQGPKFLDTIKNKLIKVKKEEPVIASQEQGPVLLENIKSKITSSGSQDNLDVPSQLPENKAATQEEIKEAGFFDRLKDKIFSTGKESDSQKAGKEGSLTSQEYGPFLPVVKKGAPAEVATVKTPKKAVAEPTKTSAANNLFNSELEQALKDSKQIEQREILSQKTYEANEEVKYEDSDEYKKFLESLEIKQLVKPEMVYIPNIKPQEKEKTPYRTRDIPEELLASRSFQNRHIPKITQTADKEDTIEKIIEYGMLENFKAYMLDIKDTNLLMDNQYTLLTFATKNKQYEIIEYLIFKGADLNKRDGRLETPLIVAVKNNDIRAVRIIVDAHADINALDILKRTPLIYSIEKGFNDVGIYLIDNGADVNITNGVNEGTLSMAIRLGRTAVKEKILDVLRKQDPKAQY